MIVDTDKVAEIIRDVAQTEIAPRFGKLQRGDIDTKTGPNDFVTQADRAAEEVLQKALCDLYPGAAFVGEEGVAANPSLLRELEGDGAVWIVDPLDGTRNFVQGREEFGSIVALLVDGEIRAGWIYAIPDDAFAIGAAGDGVTWKGECCAPVKGHGGPIRGYRAIGNMAAPWNDTMVPKLRKHFYTDSARCSAYVYIQLVTGAVDFALYSRCSPWDHAAGVLMVNELGGFAAYLDTDKAYRPIATAGRPLLIANNQSVAQKVKTTLL